MANHLRNLRRRLSNVKSEEGVSAGVAGLGVFRFDEEFPSLKSVSNVAKRLELLRQKLQFCTTLAQFNSMDPEDKQFVTTKRKALLDLVDFLNSGPARSKQEYLTEQILYDLIHMVKRNLFVALPPQVEDYDPDEDEPWLDTSWPHKQVVYELLLRLVVSSDFPAKVGKKEGLIDQEFCIGLINLFQSDDPRERDYLKTILHRIYGKFMTHRGFIRKQINFVFASFTYERERQNGIAELLEILGSIINGFALPLKVEHLQFIEKSLIPLHKSPWMMAFTSQLTYCITQYIEKDPNTGQLVLEKLVSFWPWGNSQKQVLFLHELEEIFELLPQNVLEQVSEPLFGCLARCVTSDHFQVCERALLLWNNENIVQLFAFQPEDAAKKPALTRVIRALARNIDPKSPHWNSAVTMLSFNVMDIYKERFGVDPDSISCPDVDKGKPLTHESRRKSWREIEDKLEVEEETKQSFL